jgi:hypothetical protein
MDIYTMRYKRDVHAIGRVRTDYRYTVDGSREMDINTRGYTTCDTRLSVVTARLHTETARRFPPDAAASG